MIANVRFLVVDDMEVMRKLTSSQLQSLGAVHIEMAENGLEALQLLRDRQFDFVLADWNMPLMTGISLLKEMRNDPALQSMPVIMITAESERSRIHEAIAFGVSDLLVKPYSANRLGDKIDKALRRNARKLVAEQEAIAQAKETPVEASVKPEPVDTIAEVVAENLGKPEAKADAERLTILAVDDTPDNLRIISRIFEDTYRVRLAHNGEKALAICKSEDPPDLILLDVMMPDLDGFEVARRLRADPNCEHIPLIFVTAMDDIAAHRRGLSLGAVDFMTKPLNPDILQLRVNNFMRLVRRQKERQEEYDDMVAAARMREDVDRILRHDLRGPLAGVAGLAQQLAAVSDLAPQYAELVRLIEQSSLLALDSITLAGELFKIETGRYTRRTAAVLLCPLLQDVTALARASFSGKNIDIVIDNATSSDACTVGDNVLLSAVFHNLIKNACEAAPAGSTVHIRLSGTAPLTLTISNHGTVPREMRDRLFTKYASSKTDGTGLGTYSAKLLVEAQGGVIGVQVDDQENLTTFTVALPKYYPT